MIEKMKIKKISPSAVVPTRQSTGAAGYDLYADLSDDKIINPHETVFFSSGIAFEIPPGYFGAVYARSGLATREGARPAPCVGIIDSDYRGAVGLPLHNDTNKIVRITPGERVAQIIFQQNFTPELIVAENLEDTERGSGGFGSTGK